MLTGVRPAGVISRRVNGHSTSSRYLGGSQHLPGSLSRPEGDTTVPQTHTVRISSTEYELHGVSQYNGGESPRQRIPDQTAGNLNLSRPHTANQLHGPSPMEQPPKTLNNAWSTTHKINNVPPGNRLSTQPRPGSVEDRLKHLLSSSSSDITTNNKRPDKNVNPYEDGELLKPPTPSPRQTTLPVDRPDVGALIEDDTNYLNSKNHLLHPANTGQRHSVNSTLSSSGYVPSNPSDYWPSQYGERPTDQSGRLSAGNPASTMAVPPSTGHENYAYQPDVHGQPPSNAPQRSTGRAGGSDLRAAWNRLYGQEGKIVNKPPPPAYKPPPNIRPASTTPTTGRKGPPPPPPVRHESTQRHGDATVTMATSSHHPPPNQSSSKILSQPMKFEDKNAASSSTHKAKTENVHFNLDPPRYPQDRNLPKSTTDDIKMENLHRTFRNNQNNNNIGTKNAESPRVPPANQIVTQAVINRSNSYEDLGMLNGERSAAVSHVDKPSRNLGLVSKFSSHVSQGSEPLSNHQNNGRYQMELNAFDNMPLNANDSIFDRTDFTQSENTSPSVTPPLPALSPSNTPPESPLLSPSNKFQRSLSADRLSTPKAPDLLTSNKPATKNLPLPQKAGPSNLHKNSPRGNPQKSHKSKKSKVQKSFYGALLTGLRDSDEDSFPFDIDNTTLTVEPSPRTSVDTGATGQLKDVHRKLDGLEAMYSEILNRMDNEHETGPRERRHSIGSSDTSSFRRVAPFRHSASHRHRGKEIRSINKRFQKLESHVVTLARSVAHLSSEMKSQNTVLQEMDRIRQEVKDLRDVSLSNHKKAQAVVPDFERFRGWVPALTNPKRVNKLTKFFGQEPPLLEIFLRRLGYEKFVQNFKTEHIGMIELPYMTEERLKAIGIPMGPRLRILQEAQLCFRQENFDIYIV